MNLRRVYFFESLLFLSLFLPSVGLATLGSAVNTLRFQTLAGAIIAHDVALTALALYFVWRANEGIAAIGWRRKGILREIAIGAALFLPLLMAIALLERVLQAAGLSAPPGPPSYLLPASDADYVLALFLLGVVATAEETIFRGYLLLRFSQVTGSRAAGVLLSSAIFALGHAYQGSLGVVAVGVIGMFFAVVYLWRGSLVAPMTMHFIQNCIGLLIAPQFS